jgi:transmembrane sensor
MADLDPETRDIEALHAAEASRWVETMRQATPGDEMRFVAWLKESPRNVRDFLLMLSLDCALDKLDADRLQSIEALMTRIDGQVMPFARRAAGAPLTGTRTAGTARAVPVETSSADTSSADTSSADTSVAGTSAAGTSGASSPAAANSRRFRWPVLAAGLVVAVGASLLWYARPAYREFETATGEQRTFELEDGSIVSLNTHSRVAVRFGAHAREVRLLGGEALFHVAHDPGRPFLVSTDDAVVQAVGTQFDVYRRDDGTVVSVLEGRVNVSPAASAPASTETGSAAAPDTRRAAAPRAAAARSLGASQEAQVSHAGSVSIREVNNVSDTVAWRERRLIFRDQTLDQIVGEFNRYRTHPIRLEGSGIGERVYTGVFDADDAESLLQVLARDPALEVERSASGTTVRLRPG